MNGVERGLRGRGGRAWPWRWLIAGVPPKSIAELPPRVRSRRARGGDPADERAQSHNSVAWPRLPGTGGEVLAASDLPHRRPSPRPPSGSRAARAAAKIPIKIRPLPHPPIHSTTATPGDRDRGRRCGDGVRASGRRGADPQLLSADHRRDLRLRSRQARPFRSPPRRPGGVFFRRGRA